MTTRVVLWIAFHVVVVGGMAVDLGLATRRDESPTVRQAAIRTAIWVGLAVAFAAVIAATMGGGTALAFLTGYVTEEALSVDNIVVIVLIFSFLRTPPAYQSGVLFWGIIGAIVMRGLFILAGAAALERFAWVSYALGALVALSGLRLAFRSGDAAFAGDRDPVLRVVRRVLPLTARYDGARFVTREAGRLVGTPLLLALLLVETTDLVFAIDSIPAIFGITRDPFVVYTSNVFAIIGLRSLYVLLARAVDRLRYLTLGVAIVLVFIGAKMLTAGILTIPTGIALAVVLGVLGVAVAASVAYPR
jgi:tellurite resistance protein TerC